jgi:hypothetical protein
MKGHYLRPTYHVCREVIVNGKKVIKKLRTVKDEVKRFSMYSELNTVVGAQGRINR